MVLTGDGVGAVAGRGVVLRIRQLLELDQRVNITHVYRKANMVADGLPALGCEATDGLHFVEHPPASLLQLLHSDYIGVFTPRLVSV